MDTGFKNPSTTGTPYNDLVNPTNAYVADGVYATHNYATNNRLYDYQTYKTFGFSIPTGATIDGIEVQVKGYCSLADNFARIELFGASGGTGNQLSQHLPSSNGIVTIGGATELWGLTWTLNDLTDAHFGVDLQGFVGNHTDTIYIDNIQVKVYYTEAIVSLDNSIFLGTNI
jgi:hypothetical protein